MSLSGRALMQKALPSSPRTKSKQQELSAAAKFNVVQSFHVQGQDVLQDYRWPRSRRMTLSQRLSLGEFPLHPQPRWVLRTPPPTIPHRSLAI